MYQHYVQHYEQALRSLKRCRREHRSFDSFLTEQSRRKECKGLPLEAFLIKPIQRLTKYPCALRQGPNAATHGGV